MSRHGQPIRIAAFAALLALGGCALFAPPVNTRGNLVDPGLLGQLKPGATTEAQAQNLLGSPTTQATFDDRTWIYVGQVTHPRIGRLPAVTRQEVVELHFNAAGVLTTVRHYDKKQAKRVAMAPGTTPSPGGSTSILEQILGNIGHLAPPTGLNGGP